MAAELVLAGEEETAELTPYDIDQDRKELSADFMDSEEMDAMTGEIAIDDMTSIVTFGADAAREVSRASDEILKSVSSSRLDESGNLLGELASVMARINRKELGEGGPKRAGGLLGSFFGSSGEKVLSMDEVIDKYQQLGLEVDKIYVKLRSYEKELLEANRQLEGLFEANVAYYHQLVKYILAGEQGLREIQAYIDRFQAEYERTKDDSCRFQLINLHQAQQMLIRRVHDLKLAEQVALQAIPMLRMIQFSHLELVRKINSAFIVTLPAFKQALAHAILQKRQALRAQALTALEQRTQELAQEVLSNERSFTGTQNKGTLSRESLGELQQKITEGINEARSIILSSDQKKRQDSRELEERLKRLPE
ncbi:MAG: toxic anion resistance protein [Blautia sp.]|nr:toxic anion resistance protein [Blautia sp.]